MEELKIVHSQNNPILILGRMLTVYNTVSGYICVDIATNKVMQLTPANIAVMGFDAKYINARYDACFKTLLGLHNAPLTNYAIVDSNYACQGYVKYIMLAHIKNKATGELIGAYIYNCLGDHFILTYDRLAALCTETLSSNFKIIKDENNNISVKQLDDTDFPYIVKEVDGDVISSKVELAEDLKARALTQKGGDIPILNTDTLNSIDVQSANYKSADDKWAMAELNLKRLHPYYYCIFKSLNVRTAPIDTLGVTTDTLYRSMNFVMQQSIGQLTFVLIHECMHIMMQHAYRFKPRTNHTLWNIACDLYINTMICKDFGIKYGGPEKKFDVKGTKLSAVIQTPVDGIFEETLQMKLDFDKDTAESIYNELLAENSLDSMQANNTANTQQSQPQIDETVKQAISDLLDKIDRICEDAIDPQQATQSLVDSVGLIIESSDNLRNSLNIGDATKNIDFGNAIASLLGLEMGVTGLIDHVQQQASNAKIPNLTDDQVASLTTTIESLTAGIKRAARNVNIDANGSKITRGIMNDIDKVLNRIKNAIAARNVEEVAKQMSVLHDFEAKMAQAVQAAQGV